MTQNMTQFFSAVMQGVPDAAAVVRGSRKYAQLAGTVSFWQTENGVVVAAAMQGLPVQSGVPCAHPVLALHIHAGGSCTGTAEKPFANAGMHYNPENCNHPFHAGDLPPLFADKAGNAWMAVLTDRFTVKEIIGKTVIVHAGADDFTTQPSGNAGDMIACGVISPTKR